MLKESLSGNTEAPNSKTVVTTRHLHYVFPPHTINDPSEMEIPIAQLQHSQHLLFLDFKVGPASHAQASLTLAWSSLHASQPVSRLGRVSKGFLLLTLMQAL